MSGQVMKAVQSKRGAEQRARRGIGGDAGRIVIGGARDEAGTETLEELPIGREALRGLG